MAIDIQATWVLETSPAHTFNYIVVRVNYGLIGCEDLVTALFKISYVAATSVVFNNNYSWVHSQVAILLANMFRFFTVNESFTIHYYLIYMNTLGLAYVDHVGLVWKGTWFTQITEVWFSPEILSVQYRLLVVDTKQKTESCFNNMYLYWTKNHMKLYFRLTIFYWLIVVVFKGIFGLPGP